MANETNQPDAQRLGDLAEIIRAYNQVTENLQKSHEALQAEVVRLQAQLASADAQLQRSKRLAALGEMAAGIAHEVRNPLAAIGLYAAMIVEDVSPLAAIGHSSLTEAADNGRKIVAAVRGLDAIVNDVLSFARDITPRLTEVPAELLFDRVVAIQRPAIAAGRIEVAIDAGDAMVLADVDLVHQALLNVVRNAIEAMTDKSAAGRPRKLSLWAKREGTQVALGIGDTGAGIAPADIDRIFNPFFTTRSTGTGLGLAIVHRIVDAHGGAVAVWNAPDSGAVFELTLPVAPSAMDEAGSESAEPIGVTR